MKGTYFEGGVGVDKQFVKKLKRKSTFSLPKHMVEALEKSILKGKINNNENINNSRQVL